MQQTRVLCPGGEDPPEKEMATHSSIQLEESMDRGAWWVVWGHQRVRHNLVTKQ